MRESKDAFRDYLGAICLPSALLSSVLECYQSSSSRVWLLDNSSSMRVRDSHIGRGKSGGTIERFDDVRRWEELQDCVAFHSKMASRVWLPSKYWLVNYSGQTENLSLCWGTTKDIPSEMSQIKKVMTRQALDQSQCPLATLVHGLTKKVAKDADALNAQDKHVIAVICTQGLSTDDEGRSAMREFRQELSSLSKLPVKVIVRLCTDDDRVVDAFNTMDATFDSVDVLDDFWGEAMEVKLHNPWLIYSYGLHRLRESGLAPEIMDDLDERPFTLDEIHQFCTLMFVGDDDSITLPLPSFSGRRESFFKDRNFFKALEILVSKEKLQFCPFKKELHPWINVRHLESIHSPFSHSQRNSEEQDKSKSAHSFSKSSRAPPSRSNSDPPEDQRRQTAYKSSRDPPPKHQPHFQSFNVQATNATSARTALTLEEVLQRWSHQPPDYKRLYHPLWRLLVTVPETFPPINKKVEDHDYFTKWKTFDKNALDGFSGDQLRALLKRAVRKAKFFLHPDKLPKDLTDNQAILFKTLWNVISERESK